MDYNCLIYQVLHGMRPYTPSERIAWEDELIEATCDYTQKLFDIVGARRVIIAMDGPVPLAKMKQQRMRRFRAVALATEERALGLREGASWDSNAITPGTAFMERLALRLRVRFPEALISDTSEAGEGEHKLMGHLRNNPKGRSVIYGLDGDLFVLAMLNQQLHCPEAELFFFREEVDKKKVAEQHSGPQFVWLNLERLAGALAAEAENASDRSTWLKEYAIAMCLLGNDFVPQSMAFRIKDDGHGRLLKMLRRLHGSGGRLQAADGSLDRDGWMQIFRWLAAEEEWRFGKAIEKKRMARRTPVGESATDALKARINDRPLEWFDEADGQLWSEGEGMHANWIIRYAHLGLDAPAGLEEWNHRVAATRYLESVQWTYDYYVHGIVNWDWMYEFGAAPLFKYVIEAAWPQMTSKGAPPTPLEQLALVLPRESYWLLPPCPERQLLVLAPELFPAKWSFHHLGKRNFWECEANIPVPRLAFVRSVLHRFMK
jgi:5'-3' exonuclease